MSIYIIVSCKLCKIINRVKTVNIVQRTLNVCCKQNMAEILKIMFERWKTKSFIIGVAPFLLPYPVGVSTNQPQCIVLNGDIFCFFCSLINTLCKVLNVIWCAIWPSYILNAVSYKKVEKIMKSSLLLYRLVSPSLLFLVLNRL